MNSTRKGSASKITLSRFDDLFGPKDGKEGAEQIIFVPLTELHAFKGHPFLVRDDEKMEETKESIKEYGVLVPGIVRPRTGGGYEIIAGHRRKRGQSLPGRRRCLSLSAIIRMMRQPSSWWIPTSRGRISSQAKRQGPMP